MPAITPVRFSAKYSSELNSRSPRRRIQMSHCRQRNRVRRFSKWANRPASGKNLKKMGTLPLTFERKSYNIRRFVTGLKAGCGGEKPFLWRRHFSPNSTEAEITVCRKTRDVSCGLRCAMARICRIRARGRGIAEQYTASLEKRFTRTDTRLALALPL